MLPPGSSFGRVGPWDVAGIRKAPPANLDASPAGEVEHLLIPRPVASDLAQQTSRAHIPFKQGTRFVAWAPCSLIVPFTRVDSCGHAPQRPGQHLHNCICCMPPIATAFAEPLLFDACAQCSIGVEQAWTFQEHSIEMCFRLLPFQSPCKPIGTVSPGGIRREAHI